MQKYHKLRVPDGGTGVCALPRALGMSEPPVSTLLPKQVSLIWTFCTDCADSVDMDFMS